MMCTLIERCNCINYSKSVQSKNSTSLLLRQGGKGKQKVEKEMTKQQVSLYVSELVYKFTEIYFIYDNILCQVTQGCFRTEVKELFWKNMLLMLAL